MPLLRPGLPPVYHEGEKVPTSVNAPRRPRGDLPPRTPGTQAQFMPGTDHPIEGKPPVLDAGGPDLTSPDATASTATGPTTTNESGVNKRIFPGSEPPAEPAPLPNADPTLQSPPDGDSHGNKAYRRKQARLEREKLAAQGGAGQNAGEPDLTA